MSNAWMCVVAGPPLVVPDDDDGNIESLALIVATLQAVPVAAEARQQFTLPRHLPNHHDNARVWDLLGQAADTAPHLFLGRPDLLPVDRSLHGVQLLVQLLDDHDGAVHEFGAFVVPAMATCWQELVDRASRHGDNWEFQAQEHHDDDEEEEEDDTDDDHAQVLLASLVRYPGALPWLWPVLEHSIRSGPPQQQPQLWRAALWALEAAWDGAPLACREHMPTAVALASPLSCATSIRLLGLIGEHATAKDLASDQLPAILNRLVEACARSRTARYACDALSTLAQGPLFTAADDDDEPSPEAIAAYLPLVLQALASGPMSPGSRNDLKVRALGTVACWATVAGANFGPFYSQWVPTLLQMLAVGGLDESLFGACLETATVIGQAVPDAFRSDAQAILRSLSLDNGMVQTPCCVFMACARIASVMKEAYAPFLETIIPRLLCRLNDQSSDLEFSDGDWSSSLGRVAADESITVALPGQGLTKVTINTTKIQEKAQMARAVYEHVAAVGSLYGPYCQASLQAFLPLVEYPYSADVRGTAAQTVAALFEAACQAAEKDPNTMAIPKAFLSPTLDILSRQLQTEDVADMEVYFAVADALSDTARTMYQYGGSGPANGRADWLDAVAEKDVETVVARAMTYLTACLQRRCELTTKKSSVVGADLIEEIDSALRQEEDLLTPLVDSVGWLLKTYRDRFVGIFEALVVPVLGGYLQSRKDVQATWSSVCLFDDCIEFCGPSAASKFSPMLLQGVLMGLSDDSCGHTNIDLKRASIYGVAQMARYAPSHVLEPHAHWIVQQLSQITGNPELHDAVVYENAVSALASTVLFHNAPFARSGFVKREIVLQQFMAALPLTLDDSEAKFCHAGLCDMVEGGEIIDWSMLANKTYAILSLLQEGEDLASPETCDRLNAIMLHCNERLGGLVGLSRAANIVSP
jgi:hypothetical protein